MKIIGVWLAAMVVASGIAVAVNVWLTQDPVAPSLIGSYFGIELALWTHNQLSAAHLHATKERGKETNTHTERPK